MTCPRCDRADCDAVTGRAGPPEVIVVERRCDGEPVDWRARALDAEAEVGRLRESLASLVESYDLTVGPGPPLPPLAKDVVRGFFLGVDDARKALVDIHDRRLVDLPDDGDLPPWLLRLLDAGLALATLVEEDIQACGNSPPPCAGCPACEPSRAALMAWARTVMAARGANR